jgi:hypothetical protein
MFVFLWLTYAIKTGSNILNILWRPSPPSLIAYMRTLMSRKNKGLNQNATGRKKLCWAPHWDSSLSHHCGFPFSEWNPQQKLCLLGWQSGSSFTTSNPSTSKKKKSVWTHRLQKSHKQLSSVTMCDMIWPFFISFFRCWLRFSKLISWTISLKKNTMREDAVEKITSTEQRVRNFFFSVLRFELRAHLWSRHSG